MARESTETILLPPSSEPGQLPSRDTLFARSANGTTAGPSPSSAPVPEDSATNQMNWKGHIRYWISKPAVKVFIALVTITAFSFLPAAFSKLGGSDGIEIPSGDYPPPDDYVMLLGDIFKFDWQNSEAVSIQWSLYGVGQYQSQISYAALDEHLLPNKALDIYVDNASQPLFSYDLPQHNSSQISAASVYSFKTERDTVFCNPQYYVPNDCYSISASVFAIDKETNDSIPLQIIIDDSGAGDFAGLYLVWDTTTDFTRIVGGQLATTGVISYTLSVDIVRSKRAQALTYFIFTVNWLLTLCSIITTAFIFRQGKKLGDSVALVPVTLILTIPTIRHFYPGDPPFGVLIDLVGFFPQMLSVLFCIVAMLAGLAVQYKNKGAGLQTGVPFNGTVEHIDTQRLLLLSPQGRHRFAIARDFNV